MARSFIEQQIENAAQDMFGDMGVRIVQRINKVAAKQGGGSIMENYQLLGKRAITVVGTTFIVVQVVTSVVGFVVSRKNEEKRIERVVRRVLEEEKQNVEQEAQKRAS